MNTQKDSETATAPPVHCTDLLDRTVLDSVDADIAEACHQIGEGCWPLELPLQMQTARYLKKLCELMARETTDKPVPPSPTPQQPSPPL